MDAGDWLALMVIAVCCLLLAVDKWDEDLALKNEEERESDCDSRESEKEQ
jgi:hypothetical protein